MRGIVGYYTLGGFHFDKGKSSLLKMTQAICHCGPGESGVWIDSEAGIALGCQRLSDTDLAPAEHQPMVSESGRYVLVLNGVIYNHLEIRRIVQKQVWQGHSDTETLLAGIEQWGLEECLRNTVGMFSLVLWDREERSLSLARDRMGERPLYYGWQGKSFFFVSDLKALRMHPDFQNMICRKALSLYIRSGYVLAPFSIFQGIKKLMPGAFLKMLPNIEPGYLPDIQFYWKLEDVISSNEGKRFSGTPIEAVAKLESLLVSVIRQQCVGDVPLGAFLSGGIDSATIVALMQSKSITPIRTFSIGFQEKAYNEAPYAQHVAKHLKTEHTEFYLTVADAMAVISELPAIYDEPFADASQIPTILLSRLARQQVAVALTGDGGDELFNGYDRYPKTDATWKRLQKVPLFLRKLANRLLPPSPLQEGLGALSIDSFYSFTNRQWKGFSNLVYGIEDEEITVNIPSVLKSAHERMMYADTSVYLPDDVLVKVDRAAMSCSLEMRIPLLDHRIVEYAWSLPDSIKYHNRIGKWPLKQILFKYVPEPLFDRPKMGFGVPIDEWLRGPLKEWAASLLDEGRLKREGYLKPKPIRKEWLRHLSRERDRHYGLWTILMFELWLENMSVI